MNMLVHHRTPLTRTLGQGIHMAGAAKPPRRGARRMTTALTVREVAQLLKVNERTIYRMAARGELPAFKVGGHWRFLREDVESWIATQKERARSAGVQHKEPK